MKCLAYIIIRLIIVKEINPARFSRANLCLNLILSIIPIIGIQFVCLVIHLAMNDTEI